MTRSLRPIDASRSTSITAPVTRRRRGRPATGILLPGSPLSSRALPNGPRRTASTSAALPHAGRGADRQGHRRAGGGTRRAEAQGLERAPRQWLTKPKAPTIMAVGSRLTRHRTCRSLSRATADITAFHQKRGRDTTPQWRTGRNAASSATSVRYNKKYHSDAQPTASRSEHELEGAGKLARFRSRLRVA